jgi:hypothetical protein
MLLAMAIMLVVAGDDPEPKCNYEARIEVARRYSLEELDQIKMMETITASDALTRQYDILKRRCEEGKPE